MQMLLYVTPQDEIKVRPYRGYDSINDALKARTFEVVRRDIPTGFDGRDMSLYRDEEFLINGTDPTCNAYASLLTVDANTGSYTPIYGNAVLLMNTTKNGEPDCRGFEAGNLDSYSEESELAVIKRSLTHFFNNPEMKEFVNQMHANHDNNMPEPYISDEPFEDITDAFGEYENDK